MSHSGFVYIMSNLSYPGALKIGATRNKPEMRARQLTSQTGAIGEFKVQWFLEVPDIRISEAILHYALKQFHFEKEYFRVELEVAILVASSVLNPLLATIQKGEKLWELKDKAIKLIRKGKEKQLGKEARHLYKKLIAFDPGGAASVRTKTIIL